MRLFRFSVVVAIATLTYLEAQSSARAAILADWDLQNEGNPPPTVPPYIVHPAPTLGAGTATPLGMNNNYTYSTTPSPTVGAVDGEDLIATPGSSTGGALDPNDFAWRVRGIGKTGGAPGTGNGWNLAAPQYTQGAEFAVNTQGFQNIVFTYDWFTTNQGIADQQARYTTDGGTNWHNVATSVSVTSGPNAGLNIATPNAFNDAIVINFAALGIHSVDNNPNFAVELVSAYDQSFDPSGNGSAFGTTYTGASGGEYNNNSGNWRFDNVIVSGTATAVPEPSSFVLAGLGMLGAGFLGCRRRRLPNPAIANG